MNCSGVSGNRMSRATTPTHYFVIPIDPETCKEILVTYKQRGEIVLEKHKEDFSFSTDDSGGEPKYVCYYKLTQEETNLFSKGEKMTERAKVQMRILTNAGDALASQNVEISISDVLNDEVLT